MSYNRIIYVRIEDTPVKLLKNVCKQRGEHLSTFARKAILEALGCLSYLSAEQKKALGIVEGLGQSEILSASTEHEPRKV